MRNQELDFEAIRAKLQRQQSPHEPSAATAGLVDWEPSLPANPRNSASLSQLNGAVAALQQRSTLRQDSLPDQDQVDSVHQAHQQLSRRLHLHRERVQQKAQEINALSLQQERAMLEVKDVMERWRREVHASAAAAQLTPEAAEALANEFLCDYESAVLAWADAASEGVVLTYRVADLYEANRNANQLAEALRRQQLNHFNSGSDRWDEWQTFWAEPAEGLRGLWAWLSSSWEQWWQAAVDSHSGRSNRQSTSRFTLTDVMIWLGSGIFSRIILDFALSLYPGLWSVAVAIVTAMTAYALYRATLAPRLDFSLAYRVLLAIGGLIIGGRL